MHNQSYISNSKQSANFLYGKLPPQAPELEESVLGAILLESDAISEVVEILVPASFYKKEHLKIYSSILHLYAANKAIDILTVGEQLKNEGLLDQIGGPVYLCSLTNRVASAAHVTFHAQIVHQKYIQRQLIETCTQIQNQAYDPGVDVNDLFESIDNLLFNINSGAIKKESLRIDSLLKQAINKVSQASKSKNFLSGVPSGFVKLDRITNGWQKSDLIILAARPSMGKTAFILSMARNMAIDHSKGVAIFSLEMSSLQLMNRLISSEAEISPDKIRSGNLSPEEWECLDQRISYLEQAKIFIDDTAAISIFEIRSKCKRLKKQHDIDLVIIDYLQLMTGPMDVKSNREQEVSYISRSLKSLAKELDIPIIALSQLNRSVEVRTGNKRPQLSDLRESGAIEQDADMVVFIHRPEKYGILQDTEGNSLKGIAEIIIAKHRNGALADITLKFCGEYTKFIEIDELYGVSIERVNVTQPLRKVFQSKMNEKELAYPLERSFSPF